MLIAFIRTAIITLDIDDHQITPRNGIKKREHLSLFSLKGFVLNCMCQAEIKTKSSVRVLFFKKQVRMQLLNSNIPRSAQNTKYSNRKAQDLLNLVLFMFCSFFVLQRCVCDKILFFRLFSRVCRTISIL